MSEAAIGVFVFATITLASALVWHRLVSSYGRAVMGSTITTAVAFQVAAYLHAGAVDPLFLIAVGTSSVVAAGVASLVGLPFRALRKSDGGN